MPRKRKLVRLIDSESGLAIDGVYVAADGEAGLSPPEGMPSSVRIRGTVWRVAYASQIFTSGPKPQQLLGFVSFGARLIVLETHVPRYQMREVLYHEMMHAYLRAYRGSKRFARALGPIEEELCDLFAECVVDLTGNNPSA